jgi:hypothetical protein
MRTWIKGLLVLIVVAGLWLGLVLTEWLPLATAEQQAARAALMSEENTVRGERNAFAALWMFEFDAPESEWESITRIDVDTFAAAARQPGPVRGFHSDAERRFGRLAAASGADPDLCGLWGANCVEQVRARTEATRTRLAGYAPRLARGERLHGYDHFAYLFEPHMDSPVPSPGALFTLQITASALDFVDGRTDEAFDRLCRNTRTWRRLRANTDSLVTDMLGVAQMSSAARVYAEMLAEMPLSFEPPCTDAFAPLNGFAELRSVSDHAAGVRDVRRAHSSELFDGSYQYLLGAGRDSRHGAHGRRCMLALGNHRTCVLDKVALELCASTARVRTATASLHGARAAPSP